MIGKSTLAPVFLALLLGTAGAVAQPPDEGPAPTAPADTRQQNGDTGSPAPAGGSTSQPAPAAGSPSDYRSSEQISEDLPVSFPVDI